MPTEIWDTNAFRNIGEGDLPDDGGKAAGADVCYSPVSVLELASKYTEGSFEHRRNAARAMRDSDATLLVDPELYLTQVFALPPAEDEFDWTQAVHAMADSTTMEELQQGVADYTQHVRRRVNLGFAKSYCEGIESDLISSATCCTSSAPKCQRSPPITMPSRALATSRGCRERPARRFWRRWTRP